MGNINSVKSLRGLHKYMLHISFNGNMLTAGRLCAFLYFETRVVSIPGLAGRDRRVGLDDPG